MLRSPADRRLMVDLLAAVAAIPPGRVASVDLIAESIGVPPTVIARLLAGLTDDERQNVPWHRVVAKGGAIGFGPHREAQFARLVREGVPVSPAAIVQDMAHVAVTGIAVRNPGAPNDPGAPAAQPPSAAASSPWRGMREKPG